ncbi:MAG: hypothetical protein NC204_07020 [Candidatus Amulumruptor caecigallinarius]|nr:hypothetical protein [Candidatus Amulumruptor caecigallinarius]
MKKLFTLLIVALIAAPFCMAKKNTIPGDIPEYFIEGAGYSGGDAKVMVSINAKKTKDVTDAMLGKAAVHGILFKGYNDKGRQGFGEESKHPALASSPMVFDQYIDFFDPFFTGGSYMNYVQIVDDTRKVTKTEKGYRVSCVVRVSKGQLQKDLTSQGINAFRSLGSGF